VWSLPRETVLADDSRGIFVYRCGEYIVALNNSREENLVLLPAEQKAELILATAEMASISHCHRFCLPPFAGAVCKIV
jgi:hypothetical protein